ncbi:MAG: hypothetical protein OK438_03335 [Thaumarchaeota archaeon]|nr:hypothetical protein [Nitrososphaerota archaeon]
MDWSAKNLLIILLLVVPFFFWIYAIWHADISQFVADNEAVSLMALGGAIAMIGGALFLSEITD